MDYLTLLLLSMVLIGFNTFAVKAGQPEPSSSVDLGRQVRDRRNFPFFLPAPHQSSSVWNKYVLYACLIGAWWSGIMVLYYTAIARGPLSVVIPLFSLNLVIPAVLGFIFLNEPLTVSKGLGLIFACMAVILLTR